MEKYGVIKEGVTPEEDADTSVNEKGATAADLDTDFRKRAASAAQNELKK